MKKLKVEESSPCIKPAIVIDGGGLLYQIQWPSNGLIKDFVNSTEKYVRDLMVKTDVQLDRDLDGSIKSDIKKARDGTF